MSPGGGALLRGDRRASGRMSRSGRPDGSVRMCSAGRPSSRMSEQGRRPGRTQPPRDAPTLVRSMPRPTRPSRMPDGGAGTRRSRRRSSVSARRLRARLSVVCSGQSARTGSSELDCLREVATGLKCIRAIVANAASLRWQRTLRCSRLGRAALARMARCRPVRTCVASLELNTGLALSSAAGTHSRHVAAAQRQPRAFAERPRGPVPPAWIPRSLCGPRVARQSD